MGLPSINVIFKNKAATVIRRSARGVVGVILLDSATATHGAHVMTSSDQIPAGLDAINKAYLTQAFIGYVNQPTKVIAYVLAADAANLSVALDHFGLQKINYIVGPPDCDAAQASEIETWVKAQRTNGKTYKAVLPDKAADSTGIINFTTDGIKVGSLTYDAPGYCARIAGLLAGTPLTISCTYAPLAEVSDIARLSDADMNTALNAGQFILYHDSEKVKVGRGVNSYQTTTEEIGEAFKHIKIVETVDIMREDIKLIVQDKYIGKYPNTYDNKCLLITAIKEYFTELEKANILEAGKTKLDIDMDAQIAYLESKGVDTSAMPDQEIKEANTGTNVFLRGSVGILYSIEDVNLNMVF